MGSKCASLGKFSRWHLAISKPKRTIECIKSESARGSKWIHAFLISWRNVKKSSRIRYWFWRNKGYWFIQLLCSTNGNIPKNECLIVRNTEREKIKIHKPTIARLLWLFFWIERLNLALKVPFKVILWSIVAGVRSILEICTAARLNWCDAERQQ